MENKAVSWILKWQEIELIFWVIFNFQVRTQSEKIIIIGCRGTPSEPTFPEKNYYYLVDNNRSNGW